MPNVPVDVADALEDAHRALSKAKTRLSRASWVSHLAPSPALLRIRHIKAVCKVIVELARQEASLYPFERPRQGRKAVSHPLPRREPKRGEPLTPAAHRESHRATYIEGCYTCYMREYLYFRRHPERRPSGIRSAGDDTGSRLRRWVSENWPERMAREAREKDRRKRPPSPGLVDAFLSTLEVKRRA